ncbi:DUF5837 family cyanobactin class RiPP [Anabaena azotica]|uniref:Microcyclamide/patellamide family RiPP n=1 Tax=Anabaena azotica FACHB-119 TaxID=947527 RepID=A0ABR8DEQ7_9NOST|nr:DUF5837 family cyanobactin class RiPP [Anabaena azotica]MBD2504682.1 microcyclamide/patellamide family RiPP [Anabaena azotica FACHB-119]
MNRKNINPQQTPPVVRLTLGTQTDLLTELSEEILCTKAGISPGQLTSETCSSLFLWQAGRCSYEDEAQ